MITANLPRYRCHKEVRAVKIKHVKIDLAANYSVVPEDEGLDPIPVSAEYVKKHNPNSTGYFVVYEDGYQSFSPAKAFEEGYTRIIV
jgi:hypothetical protein